MLLVLERGLITTISLDGSIHETPLLSPHHLKAWPTSQGALLEVKHPSDHLEPYTY